MMTEKRFRKVMGFIQDNTCEGGDVEGVMDLTEIEDRLNALYEENEQLKFENETLKSNYQREIQSSIDFCNAYSKTNGELLEKIEKLEKENEQLKKRNKFLEEFDGQAKTVANLKEENEQLKQKIKHCVYVDVDNANGCMNCKYDKGSICSILNCGTHDYLEGVSECGLKYWEYKDE